MTLDQMIEGILVREGGYVDHPSDPGRATKYGITQKVARAHGYAGPMREFPITLAREIYRREYIEKPGLLGVAEIDPLVAEEVIDSGVNAGPKRAGLWFQQALNALNRRGMDYADIGEDGTIGPATLDAFRALRRRRGEVRARQLMLKALNGLQFRHYFSLVQGNARFEDFMAGWLENRIGAA
jgi:lysozyme family protein